MASSDRPPSAEEREILTLVNEVRAEGATCGGTAYPAVEALTWNERLARAARKHSGDMEAAGELAHVTPEGAVHYPPGTTLAGRVEREGYTYATLGENVAFGATSPAEAVDLWLASPGHCRNLVRADFRELGVGRAGAYWTQNFGTHR